MDYLLSHCAKVFSAEGGLYLAFFLAGLTGGFTHCIVMCGPFAACEGCAGKACAGRRKAGTPALAYHLGRLTVYAALGFTVALLSSQVAALPWWPRVAAGMLGLAGLSFLWSCLPHGRAESKAAPVARSARVSYARGVLLGFMPCGLLYAALMMAAAMADPIRAMAAMGLFALGTMPALLLVGEGARYVSRKWQHLIPRAGRAVMAFNGLSLLAMAVTFR